MKMSDTVIPMPRVGCGKFISFANSALNHGNSVMPIPILIVLIKTVTHVFVQPIDCPSYLRQMKVN